MAKIIRSVLQSRVSCYIEFTREDGSGYAFPCDEEGVLLPLSSTGIKSFLYAMEHEEEFPVEFFHFAKYEKEYQPPNVLVCDCGKKVTMDNFYYGAIQCPKCGRWYNSVGSEILPPDYWEE